MAKKNKGFFGNEEDVVEEFVEEDLEEFGELVEEVEGVEPESELELESQEEVEPEPVEPKGTLMVSSLRSWVYPEPDIFSKPVGGVSRGNRLPWIDGPIVVDGREWHEVLMPTRDGPKHGFIEVVRVTEV